MEDIESIKKELEELRKENAVLQAEIDRLKELIQVDLMTGLRNKYTIGQDLERAISYSQRFPETTLSVIFADLDYFKKVNDAYGHLVGDQVLIWIANLLRKNLRSYDFIGRYGGEEFLIILQKVDLRQVREIAEKLRKVIEGAAFEFIDDESKKRIELRLTMSFGVAEWRSGMGVFELIESADRALYRAKRLGRNRVVVNT